MPAQGVDVDTAILRKRCSNEARRQSRAKSDFEMLDGQSPKVVQIPFGVQFGFDKKYVADTDTAPPKTGVSLWLKV